MTGSAPGWALPVLVLGVVVVSCGRGLLENPGVEPAAGFPPAADAASDAAAAHADAAAADASPVPDAGPDAAVAPDDGPDAAPVPDAAPDATAPETSPADGPLALTAVFDPTLRAPACRTVGAACDSGDLLDGRADLGPEKNAPNTIHGACPDGISGEYRVARSIDGLRVSTADGSSLAPGKTARIELTVFACNCDTGGHLDEFALFVARDATDPVWIPLNVLSAGPTPGRQVLTATFTVPSGKLEAVRATIIFATFPEVCAASGSSDSGAQESDDLVFAVNNEGPDFAYVWPEAESAVVTKPLVVATGLSSSGDRYLQVPAGRKSLAAPPPDGHAVVSFTVPAAGRYRLWGRAQASSEIENSFWVRVDSAPFVRWDDLVATSSWHWQRVHDSDQGGQPLQLDLAAGNHQLELAYREDNALLDRLLITDDPLLDPAQQGETPGPPPPPADLRAARTERGVMLEFTVVDFGTDELKIRRGTAPGGPYPVRFESNSRFMFEDGSASRGTRYCYVIRASNGAGDGPPTAEVCVAP